MEQKQPPETSAVTLVLLPGMDGTGFLFEEFIAALGPGINPVIVSYPAKQILDYAQLESFAHQHLPIGQPFMLLGESFSGPIAISLAATAPPGLAGLILCCSFARNPRPSLSCLQGIVKFLPITRLVEALNPLLLGRFGSVRLRSQIKRALAGVSSATLRGRLLAVLTVDVSHALAQVQVPVLYLRASEDWLVPASASQLIAALSPRARVATVEGPHMLLQAAPESSAWEVRKFASRCHGPLKPDKR